ncbi:hypothetical protein HDU84_005287 [Entophlyctis sp. JEL0112]|nr:hypothetical protein HDU84_005287 [Entophlyctis sp. JEL0112]
MYHPGNKCRIRAEGKAKLKLYEACKSDVANATNEQAARHELSRGFNIPAESTAAILPSNENATTEEAAKPARVSSAAKRRARRKKVVLLKTRETAHELKADTEPAAAVADAAVKPKRRRRKKLDKDRRAIVSPNSGSAAPANDGVELLDPTHPNEPAPAATHPAGASPVTADLQPMDIDCLSKGATSDACNEQEARSKKRKLAGITDDAQSGDLEACKETRHDNAGDRAGKCTVAAPHPDTAVNNVKPFKLLGRRRQKIDWRACRALAAARKREQKAALRGSSSIAPPPISVEQLRASLEQLGIEALEALMWDIREQLLRMQNLEYVADWPYGKSVLNSVSLSEWRAREVERLFFDVKALELLYQGDDMPFVSEFVPADAETMQEIVSACLRRSAPHRRALCDLLESEVSFQADNNSLTPTLQRLLKAQHASKMQKHAEDAMNNLLVGNGRLLREQVSRRWSAVRRLPYNYVFPSSGFIRKQEQLEIIKLLSWANSGNLIDDAELDEYQRELDGSAGEEAGRALIRVALRGAIAVYRILAGSVF